MSKALLSTKCQHQANMLLPKMIGSGSLTVQYVRHEYYYYN